MGDRGHPLLQIQGAIHETYERMTSVVHGRVQVVDNRLRHSWGLCDLRDGAGKPFLPKVWETLGDADHRDGGDQISDDQCPFPQKV